MTRRGLPALVVLALVVALIRSPSTAAAATAVLPDPELVLTPTPLPLLATRPLLEPPPPLPSLRGRPVELGLPPLPPFDTAVRKGLPPAPDGGVFPCGLASMLGRPAPLVRCGTALVVQGELGRAREVLEEALAADPAGDQSALATLWLAEIDFHEGRRSAAAARYEAALARGLPAEPGGHASIALGGLALARGDTAGALAILGRVSAPAAPRVSSLLRFLEAVARLLRGDAALALSLSAETASGNAPPELRPELLFWRGVALLQRWEPEPALQTLNEALRSLGATHPLRAEALAQRGWAELMRGTADRALGDFSLAASVDPAILQRHLPGFIRAYTDLGRFREAREAVRRLAVEQPDSAQVLPLLLHLAEEAHRRQALEEALESYGQLRARPLEPAVRAYVTYRIAEVLDQHAAQSGDPAVREQAVVAYRRLRDEGGDEGLAQRGAYWLALASLRAGRPAAALGECEDLLRAGPSPELQMPVLILAAEAAARAGAPNRAMRLYRSALAASPDSPRVPELRLALGWALRDDGDVGIALQEWQRAARLGNEAVATAAYEGIAMAALAGGYDVEALDALGELERRGPAHVERELIRLNRGVLLARRGDDAGALDALRPLLAWGASLDREAAVRRTLGIVLYRMERFADAAAMFHDAAQREPGVAANWLGAGLAAYRQGRPDEADRALQRARLSSTPEIAVTAAYAFVLARLADPNEFRRRAGAFLAAYGGEARSALLVSRLVSDALAAGMGPYALAWTRWLVKEQPTNPVLEDVLAQLVGAEHADPAFAREAHREVMARTQHLPTKLLALVGLARAATALGRTGEAREALGVYLGEAPATDPRLPWVYGQLVRLYETERQREQVLLTIEAFLARFPGDPGAPAMQLRRGELLMAERRWPPAQEALELARDASDPAIAGQAHVRLGELFLAQGEHDAAVQEYLGAVYLYPGTRSGALGLQGAAQSYAQRQRPRDARIVLEKLAGHAGADAALMEWARTELRRFNRTPAGAGEAAGPRRAKPR